MGSTVTITNYEHRKWEQLNQFRMETFAHETNFMFCKISSIQIQNAGLKVTQTLHAIHFSAFKSTI